MKNHLTVGTTTDCFEPIFGFLRSFWFEKYRSAPWNRIGMFSELSGRSDNRYNHHFAFCCWWNLSENFLRIGSFENLSFFESVIFIFFLLLLFFLRQSFWIFFASFPYISQGCLVSKAGSKFWSSQMWQHFFTQTEYYATQCIL